jgi:hypothetical protein
MRVVLAAALAVTSITVLTACSADSESSASKASPTPAPSLELGDLSACRAYARLQPQAQAERDAHAGGGVPTNEVQRDLERSAGLLNDASGTASGELKAQLTAAASGYTTYLAATKAIMEGPLSAAGAVEAIVQATTKVAAICAPDSGATYVAIKP